MESLPPVGGTLLAKHHASCGHPSHKQARVSEAAIRSLLALGKNPAFSRAIAELLNQLPCEPEPSVLTMPRVGNKEASSALPSPSASAIQDGFAECGRSRDGPVVR
jgi:hypothetical protein